MANRTIKKSCNEYPTDYQFNGIDIIRFICAFLVCIIHIQPFNVELIGIKQMHYFNFVLQQYLCRIAVPFYFTASGFLLFRKTDIKRLDDKRIKNYCFKLLRLLGTWSFLLFVDGSIQLWYLGALVLAVMILSILIKKGLSLRCIFIISTILFIVGLLGDSYYGFIEPLKSYFIPRLFIVGYGKIFSTTRNGVFFGLIFVLIGAVFAQRRIVINNMLAVVGFFASLLIMFFEVHLLKSYSHPKEYDMFVSLLPVTFFLFYLATHIELKNRKIYGSLRTVGMLVFFMHMFINYFVGPLIKISKNKIGINLSAFQFVLTICITTLFAVLIERLSKLEKFQWLKYLYS